MLSKNFHAGIYELLFSIVIVFLISGCTSRPQKRPTSSAIKRIVLKKDLEIPAMNDSLLIGGFNSVASDAKGRMYAIDAQQVRIWIFGPDGHFLDTLGRKGKGPGEFSSLYTQPVISGDTLYVLDPQARRISLFRTGANTLLGSINIPQSGSKKKTIADRGISRQMFVPPGGLIGIVVESFSLKKYDNRSWSEMAVLLLKRDGTWKNQNLIDRTANRYVTIRNGNAIMMMSLKCTVRGFMKYGGGHIFVARNDSSSVERYDIDGKKHLFTNIDAPSYPLSFSQVDSLAGGYDKKNIEPGLRKEKFRKIWPYFQDMIVDYRGNLWVEITAPGKKMNPWWIYDKSGKKRWETALPSDVFIKEITNHEIYAVKRTKDGATAVERYSIPREL